MDDKKPIKFPDSFLWGASLSAHQAEGFNVNDWSVWEEENASALAAGSEAAFSSKVPNWEKIRPIATSPKNYISGAAADHYNRYKEDIKLCKELGLKVLRFSVEWSRVEPRENFYNQEALDHYLDFVQRLKKEEIIPIVTLHHRTNPLWVKDQGDWENPKTVLDFGKYTKKILDLFKGEVKYWTPINEPIMSLSGGYIGGVYPPGKKSLTIAFKVFANLVAAQNLAYRTIHSSISGANVGISHASIYTTPHNNNLRNRLGVWILDKFANQRILSKTLYDFVGIQYYTRSVIDFRLTKSLLPKVDEIIQPGIKTDMGWEIYPQGLYDILTDTWHRYKKPIIITENGIADHDDSLRAGYIKEHLKQIHQAIEDGVKVNGYLYWSLIDNMEWNKGFWPRFGLIEVDYQNFERRIRSSARVYSEIIRNSGF